MLGLRLELLVNMVLVLKCTVLVNAGAETEVPVIMLPPSIA